MRFESLPSPRLVKASHAAVVLGVSVRTIYSLVESGELASLKIGRCVRIPVEALDEYANSWRQRDDHQLPGEVAP